MKYLLAGLVSSIALSSAAVAQAADPALMGPINQFVNSFNKGDQKGAAKAFTPAGAAIIDEVSPYFWTGPKALQLWSAALAAESKKGGLTDQSVTIAAPTSEMVSGVHGYVVVPATYHYKEHGKAMHESAQMTYALLKGAGGWKISAWTWSATTPQPGDK